MKALISRLNRAKSPRSRQKSEILVLPLLRLLQKHHKANSHKIYTEYLVDLVETHTGLIHAAIFEYM